MCFVSQLKSAPRALTPDMLYQDPTPFGARCTLPTDAATTAPDLCKRDFQNLQYQYLNLYYIWDLHGPSALHQDIFRPPRIPGP